MLTSRITATVGLALISLALPLTALATPEVKTQDKVSYLTGGVGSDERAAIRSMAKQFNLEVAIATKKGHFLGDGAVHIEDVQGHTVLQANMDGPLFYVQLEPGTYTVSISRDGKAQQRTVEVAGSGQKSVLFRWNSD
ncbi:MAG TPA: hypothetical protein VN812_21130 [Candidatus Acidoferrales bacterium]|nr:hypothetical protein [Candidatus Acidoferrales bacterium]